MAASETVLILAAHGSSFESAQRALTGFARRVQSEHPGVRVLFAGTAMRHPHKRDEASPMEETLESLAKAPPGGPMTVRVQSLHVIAGAEFDRMRQQCLRFAAQTGTDIKIAGPLLLGAHNAPLVARTLAESLTQHAPDEAIVLMGHGTTHAAQELYRILAAHLASIQPLAFLGVLEAAESHNCLSVHTIARSLAKSGIRRARLVPFLTVAGRHAHKDLAGEDPGSWKSILAGHGIEAAADLTGLVEREGFARLWLAGVSALLTGRP